LPGHWS